MDLIELIKAAGYLGLSGIIFAESGLFFGFFLPGDSLLFTAGFLASQGFLNIWLATILVFVAAVAGDSVGYAFGKKAGPAIFNRENSRFFKKENLIRAEKFYEKNGPKTIIIARFLPIVRTFAPIVAGVGSMNYSKFIKYNIIGGFLWSFGLMFAGYFLGRIIPGVDKYLLPIILLIVVLSVLPSVMHIIKEKRQKTK
ncbi:MAG: VTT domain-containing protein [Candidatus Falkowbacteria bacterium]